jgi:hypothetical protein
MAENAPDSRLMAALELVNDWLRYAEMKNAALLTLNGALIVSGLPSPPSGEPRARR